MHGSLIQQTGKEIWPSSKDTGQSLHGAVWWGLGSWWWKIGTLGPLLYPKEKSTWARTGEVNSANTSPLPSFLRRCLTSALDRLSNRGNTEAYKAQLGKEMEWHFSTRHMVCQPSIRQWLLQLFPSAPKSLGRGCEQLLFGMSVVHRALGGCPGQHFPPQAGGTQGAAGPLCPPVSGSQLGARAAHLGFMFSLFPLMQLLLAQERLCLHPFFEDTGRILSPQTVCSGHWNAVRFPPQCMWQGLPFYLGFLQ